MMFKLLVLVGSCDGSSSCPLADKAKWFLSSFRFRYKCASRGSQISLAEACWSSFHLAELWAYSSYSRATGQATKYCVILPWSNSAHFNVHQFSVFWWWLLLSISQTGGSLFLFNRRILRFFRKDGHAWRRKKDGRTVGEAHERLKVWPNKFLYSWQNLWLQWAWLC